MSSERVVVIGGGIGGLSACLELAHLGFDVTLLEKELTVGGKIRQVAVGAPGDELTRAPLCLRCAGYLSSSLMPAVIHSPRMCKPIH
jgi:phytoene dehydrogenase-like protein